MKERFYSDTATYKQALCP